MLLVVCGPPGVGKTTVATRLRERLTDRGRPFRILHSDDLSDTYDAMVDRVRDSDDDWILDGTFYKEGFRTAVRELDHDVVFVHLLADLETCLARNRAREDPIDEQGVHVVYNEFAPLDADIRVDTADRPPGEVVARVLRELEPYLP